MWSNSLNKEYRKCMETSRKNLYAEVAPTWISFSVLVG